MKPGAIVVTWILNLLKSIEKDSHIFNRALLDPQYAAAPGSPTKPATEEIATRWPPFFSMILNPASKVFRYSDSDMPPTLKELGMDKAMNGES